MPLDRLSALRRALVPRIGLGLTFTSRTVHSLQHPASPDPLDTRRRQNPLMPAVPTLTVTHDSQPLPGLGNLLNGDINHSVEPFQFATPPGRHLPPFIRKHPQVHICLPFGPQRASGATPWGIPSSAHRGNVFPANVFGVGHDASTPENDSHFHQPTTPADLEPQAYHRLTPNRQKYTSDSKKS